MIEWNCYECGAPMAAEEGEVGRRKLCRKCGAVNDVLPRTPSDELFQPAGPKDDATDLPPLMDDAVDLPLMEDPGGPPRVTHEATMPGAYVAGGFLLLLLGVLLIVYPVFGGIPPAIIVVGGVIVWGLGGIAGRIDAYRRQEADRDDQ